MTSGKSTLGKILANVFDREKSFNIELGWNYFDLDQELEKDESTTVTGIFETKGENYFRKIENIKLRELSKYERIVISLGGGTLIDDDNVKFIKQKGKLVYLRVTPEIIYTRIKKKTDRPLFKDFVLADNTEEDFIKKIRSMLEEREKYYNLASIIFDVDNSPIGKTVDKLAKIITRIIIEENKIKNTK